MLSALYIAHSQKRLWLSLSMAVILLLLGICLGAKQADGAAKITEATGASSATCMSSYYADKIAEGSTDVPESCNLLWQSVSHPDVSYLRSIAAVSANDIYVAGLTGLLHWNGSTWTVVRSGDYIALAAKAANDVWAWRRNESGPAHWNGTNWTVFTAPDPDIEFHVLVIGDSTHAWAGGTSDFRGSPTPVIIYWNGTTWANVSCCEASGGGKESDEGALNTPQSFSKPDGGGCEPYNHLTAGVITGVSDAWFVGTEGSSIPCNTSSPTLYHVVNGARTTCCTSIAANIGMGRAGAHDSWAVGSTASLTSTIAHYTGGDTWQTIASPNIGPLTGISGSSASDVWAVGGGGFLHYNGSYWSSVATNGVGASAVASIDINNAWAISNTTILHYQGTDFTDVALENTFFGNIRCLYCQGIMAGYTCGGTNPQTGAAEPCDPLSHPYFRYNNVISRGQISKLVANAAGFTDDPGAQRFTDVLPGSTFYAYINRLASRNIMSGYPCGGAGEPCDSQNRPYFRPGTSALRAQLCKIVSNAAGFSESHTETSFQDVPPTSPFYIYVQRLVSRNVLGGYRCGGAGEPCIPPGNLPYFRPTAKVSRGQSARITGNAFFPTCQTGEKETR